ncbi:MAG: divalent-cation tolerance protein CutA [Myxococcota bacterium]|jgi:periplasmic divalent cation tolerance protein
MKTNHEAVLVLMTAPDPVKAAELGRAAVDRGFAACASVVPGLRSIYRWKGGIQDEPEALVIFKTTRAHLDSLEGVIKAGHPYEVPEIIAIPIEAGHGPYLKWITESTIDADSDQKDI